MFGPITPVKSCKPEEFRAPVEVKGKLSDGIDDIFIDRGKSCPFRPIVQINETEVLFNDLVSFDFILS